MNSVLSWYIFIIIILGIGIIILLILLAQARFVLINPNDCPQIRGSYGVKAGVTGSVLNKCGSQSNQNCVFSATSLKDAISQCDAQPSLCSQFIYSPNTATMTIIDPNSKLSDNSATNLYIRQVPVIIS